tara:strand:+ start:4863 stop:6752 length:1890 start_codon:yes stop_codon:yes gene_type:complete
MSQIVIGMAGHIDHGKTALVKELTGVDTDRLPDEKARGMTIDLGFAFLTEDITIIDVPGHEKFIRNMVAGVSTVDIALVAIAADDGIMPQTKEHVEILNLLNIKHGCIVITKVDLVEDPEWLDLMESDISDFTKGTFLENAPMVRVSSTKGEGINELKELLINLSAKVETRKDRGFFRLYVDRVFPKKGFGTIITGTVNSGSLKKGDEVTVVPGDFSAKVRGVQSHGKDVPSVKIGDRAAINLAAVEKDQIKRGTQLSEKGILKSTGQFIANLKLLKSSPWALKNGHRVRIHVGTDEVMGRIYSSAEAKGIILEPDGGCTAFVRLEKPAAMAIDDPVIVRSYSPMVTIGGGNVLDVNPPRKWESSKVWLEKLDKTKESPKDRLTASIEAHANSPMTVEEWSKNWYLTKEKILKIFEEINITTFGNKNNPTVTLPKITEAQKQHLLENVEKFHKDQPYRQGIAKDTLKHQLGFSDVLFSFLISELEEKGDFTVSDGRIKLASFQVKLSDDMDELSAKIVKRFKSENNLPLLTKELSAALNITPSLALEILHVMKNENQVIEVERNFWILADYMETIKKRISDYFDTHQAMSVGDFKTLTKASRKHAIPLLEYLDNQEFTRRDGDKRILAK